MPLFHSNISLLSYYSNTFYCDNTYPKKKYNTFLNLNFAMIFLETIAGFKCGCTKSMKSNHLVESNKKNQKKILYVLNQYELL